MKPLTQKQQEILDYLVECVRENNYVPTLREIAAHFEFRSVNAVNDHLNALEKKGVLSRRANSSRGIEIASEYLNEMSIEPSAGVPIVGRVAAGTPIAAIENLDGYLELGTLYTPQKHYALRVHGDSMIDDGIWDGDFVIVHEQNRVENGEIGVAIVEGEATVKRIRIVGARAELIPANTLYSPILVDLAMTDFRVGGKVVGIHRLLK